MALQVRVNCGVYIGSVTFFMLKSGLAKKKKEKIVKGDNHLNDCTITIHVS